MFPRDLQWLSQSELKSFFLIPVFVFTCSRGEPYFRKAAQIFLSAVIGAFSIFKSKQKGKHSHSFDPWEEFTRNLWKILWCEHLKQDFYISGKYNSPKTLFFLVKASFWVDQNCFQLFCLQLWLVLLLKRMYKHCNSLQEAIKWELFGHANTVNDQNDNVRSKFLCKHCKICHVSCDINKHFKFNYPRLDYEVILKISI